MQQTTVTSSTEDMTVPSRFHHMKKQEIKYKIIQVDKLSLLIHGIIHLSPNAASEDRSFLPLNTPIKVIKLFRTLLLVFQHPI